MAIRKTLKWLHQTNLCNVKTLSIFLHLHHFGSRPLPPSVLDTIFELKIHDLQLDGVSMTTAKEMVILFSRLSPTLKTLAFRAVDTSNCLDRFRSMFPNLTLIKIILNNRKPEKTDVFFEALRRVKGLRELEEIGIVKLATFHMEKHVACHSVLETCM